jgi:hypothetical protein
MGICNANSNKDSRCEPNIKMSTEANENSPENFPENSPEIAEDGKKLNKMGQDRFKSVNI